jgi:hypothetical protein
MRKHMTRILTAVTAVLLTMGGLLGAGHATAGPYCTDQGYAFVPYSNCTAAAGAHCTPNPGGVTCVYPDGSRDECTQQGILGPSSCVHIP